MTERLYYSDSYLRTFTARIVDRVDDAGRQAVILDRSAFYPEGGGQPADRGTLNHAHVVDVVERGSDGAVLHGLSQPIREDEATGTIDFARRFDLMQQHTGQHILSQAFVQVAEAQTVSFHLGADSREGGATIDLDTNTLRLDQIDRVEDLANSLIFEDRPVIARFVSAAELQSIPLRRPPTVDGPIRIVEIERFDWSACGGTHVARTGEVGVIKITRLDRQGNQMRIEFRCGQRALLDYRRKHSMIDRVAASLSVGYWELDQAVARLQADHKSVRKQLAGVDARLQQVEARELLSASERRAGYRLVVHVWPDRDAAYLRRVANLLVAQPATVALLGGTGSVTALVFARSKDLPVDLSALLKAAAARIGAKGGGSPDFAQAGGPPLAEDQIKVALEWAASQLSGNG